MEIATIEWVALDLSQKLHREGFLTTGYNEAQKYLRQPVYKLVSEITPEQWEAAVVEEMALETDDAMLGKAKRNWQLEISDFTDAMRLVHLAARMDAIAIEGLRKSLLAERVKAYEDELSLQAARVGCPGRKAILNDNSVRSKMNADSTADAENIANTFNYDLARAVEAIREVTPTANRYVYAKRLSAWEGMRRQDKAAVVTLNTLATARALAQQDFYNFNFVSGVAVLVPDVARCPICQGWINRGEVPLDEAMLHPPPYHVRCPHWFKIFPEKTLECSTLWLGG